MTGVAAGSLEADFLEDGRQSADEVAGRLAAFVDAANRTIDAAIYDFRARDGSSARVADALEAAAGRGVRVRVVFNRSRECDPSHTPPMQCDPDSIDGLEVPTRGVHDGGALMHHKYVVRDGRHVWTGSTNWTDDSFSREENAILRIASAEVAAAYTRNFERLWEHERVEPSGGAGPVADLGGGVSVEPLFSPHGPSLAHRVAERLAAADRMVRICSPVLTSGAILGTLAEIAGRSSFDLVGAYDATQMHQVVRQWEAWPPNHWKITAWEAIRARLVGKVSTPWSPNEGAHDFMHAKVVVADGEVLTGSYNLSRGGEDNAENLVHIRGGAIAERFRSFVERVANRYASPADR